MDKLYAMTAFIRIVEGGSLTAAADALDVSQPSMVRTLAALERELGTRLLHRTTRRMSLTDEGRDYYERARQIVAAVDEAELSLSARQAAPRGRLRIASSVSFGRTFVAPVVAEFLSAHPAVAIDLLLLDRLVDLVEEGMDVAVRVAVLPDSSMVAHPIGEVRRVVVASPDLLKKSGRPRQPRDLGIRRCVSFTGVGSPGRWEFHEGRKRVQVPVSGALTTNQIDAAVQACVNGVGFGRFFDYHVLAELHAGKLVTVLEKFSGPSVPVNLLHASGRHASPNVRAFVRFAQPRIRERLQSLQRSAIR